MMVSGVGAGSISPIPSRQPSVEPAARSQSTNKESSESLKTTVTQSSVSSAQDDGHGQVQAYQSMQRHAPVERRPEMGFENVVLEDSARPAEPQNLERAETLDQALVVRRVSSGPPGGALGTDAASLQGPGARSGVPSPTQGSSMSLAV